jgi:hypothetical protein
MELLFMVISIVVVQLGVCIFCFLKKSEHADKDVVNG